MSEINNASFLRRFWIYQKERFPFLQHGVLILVFSFSAISYARISAGKIGFIDWKIFLPGAFITFTMFLMLRIFDEFKDEEEDKIHRSQLPVPRGLIKLNELKIVGIVVVILQILVQLIFFPKMLFLYAFVMIYMTLMAVEFFIPKWLVAHHFWYVVSHMVIIPFVDIFASGLDWFIEGEDAPFNLIWFFAVSFMNGIVLEFGRKIRTPENEEINTYSTKLGMDKATWYFLISLVVTWIFALVAAYYAGYGMIIFIILTVFLIACSIPAILFLQNKKAKLAKGIEIASGIWTLAMYLILGAGPMLFQG